jgi:RNA polymerase sigma-70 factor, ECF subfamily
MRRRHPGAKVPTGLVVCQAEVQKRTVSTPPPPNVTQLLVAWSNGDRAALDALAPLVHQELHHLAARYMAGERPGHVLQATALVNEAYLRLVDWKNVQWQNRAHFFGVAAQLMRRVLVDIARTRQRAKRGGGELHVSLSEAAQLPVAQSADFVALDDALKVLETLDPRQSRVVELRFFGGLTLEETAHVLNVSVGTVRRDWSLAQAWLYRELSGRQ